MLHLDDMGSARELDGGDPLILGLKIALEDPDGSIVGTLTTRDDLAFFRNDVAPYGYRLLREADKPIYGRLAYALHSILGVGADRVEFSLENGCCVKLHAPLKSGSDKQRAIQRVETAWRQYPFLRKEEQATVLFDAEEGSDELLEI